MHYLKRKTQGKDGYSALKIDMSKAYDRIEWGFISAMMLQLGFDQRWIDLIMMCITSVSYNIVHNGKEYGPIIPGRGLRQGDPLSPYLFILCAEGLSALLTSFQDRGLIHGCKVARSCPMINHLLFADDSFIFFKAKEEEGRNIMKILHLYEVASGQIINFQKSSISFSANVDDTTRQVVSSLLQVEETLDHGHYLGLPSLIGRNKKEVFQFIKDRVWQKLQSWKRKILSQAGKEVLLKTVAQAMPNYAMGVFLLPIELCTELERMMNSFWWGGGGGQQRGINWMRWERLCKTKRSGGLGFKKLHDFNIAMLGKQGWKLLTDPNSLFAKVLKSKYFPNCSFLEASLGHNPSYTWMSIRASQELIRGGCRWRIGGGNQVSIWRSKWLPDDANASVTSSMVSGMEDALVSSLMMSEQRSWNYEKIEEMFNDRDKQLILSIPLSLRNIDDRLVWCSEDKGDYTVRSAYRHLQMIGETGTLLSMNSIWLSIWNLKVPPRVRNMLWRACHGILPTANVLRQRRVNISEICPVCNGAIETIFHSLVTCPFSVECWIQSPMGYCRGDANSFMEWVVFIFSKFNMENCRYIWLLSLGEFGSIGTKLCGNRSFDKLVKLSIRLVYFQNWKEAQLKHYMATAPNNNGQELIRWQRPDHGWVKINVDAAVFATTNSIGTGCVARAANGSFLAARTHYERGKFEPKVAEAIGIREALSWVKNRNWSKVLIESDAQVVIRAINDQVTRESSFGLVVNDCKSLAKEINNVQFLFVKRSANCAAHELAHVAISESGPRVWDNIPPSCISNILLADLSY